MKLVVGLGNPGRKYERTRHNIGFMAVEDLARALHAGAWKGESRAEVARASLDGQPVLLARPQTFMNDSGRSVRELAGFYKLAPPDILVIADDLDLPFATLRLRPNGSAGGHNGLKSIIAELGTQDFPRLRLGIGRPDRGDTIDYVLAPFAETERADLPLILGSAVDAALSALGTGVLAAMNEHNGRGDLRLPPRAADRSGAPTTGSDRRRSPVAQPEGADATGGTWRTGSEGVPALPDRGTARAGLRGPRHGHGDGDGGQDTPRQGQADPGGRAEVPPRRGGLIANG